MAHSTAWARCSAIVALVGLALTWNAGPAWAAACCVGSTSDKAGLLGAAVDKHGLLDACAGLTGAMSMSGHAAEGEGEAPAEEKTE